MVKTVTFRRYAFLALTALGFASGVWAVDGYKVKCVHYYQDSAVMLNSSPEFVAEVGLLGGFTNGQQAVLTCDPKAIPTLQHSAGYYVTGWDLDADWGDHLPIPGVFTPTHLKQYDSVNPLEITFSYASLGVGPRTCELVPHISMMHYTLAYDKNASDATGTAPEASDHYYSEDVSAAASNVFARTGYTPIGWNTATNGSGVAIAFEQENITGATFPVTNHNQVVTLYAQWQVNQYTLRLTIGTGIDKIYYKVNGATSWMSTNVSRDVPVAFGTTWCAYAVAKSGYTYTASSAEKLISGKMTIEGANFAPIASANKIRVAYDGNGKTSGSMSATDFTYNESRKLADVSYSRSYTVTYNRNYAGGSVSSDRSNYEFVGWNDAADGTGAYSYADGEKVTNPCGSTGGNITLFAQWRPVAVTLPNPVRTGYDFLGWYSDRTGTNAVGRADELYVPTQSITVYAKWKVRSYTVTFVDKTGEQTIRTESVSYGDSATAPIAPTRPGESFSTWNTDDYRKVTKDLVVKAKYDTVKYHVTYHSNYQDPKMSDRSVLSVGCGPLAEYSDRITLLDVGSSDLGFSKKGYRFLGWSWMSDATENDFNAGATVAWNQIAERLEVVGSATQSADLYAVWVPITYTIRFEPGIATGETTNQLMIYDRPARLQKNPYTLDHQNLLFWDRGVETFFDQQLVTNLTTTADEIIGLTATWDGNGDHTVMFNGNGATNRGEYAQGFVGSTAQHLTSNQFERTGCEFKGWMTNDIISTSVTNSVLYHDRDLYQFSESAPRYSTNTLYAAWDPIEYTLLFNTGTNGVTGTMQPLVFYGTNTEVTFIYEYSEINGQSLKGWTRTQGSQEVEYGLTRKIDTKRTAINGISNLVDSAGNGVTLYAVWEGIGDLSVAAGLTNAVLKSDSWTVRSEADTNYVGVIKTEPSTYEMSAKVIGPGRFTFDWYWDVDSDDSTFKIEVRTNSTVSVDKKTICTGGTGEWQTYKDYDITVTGECTVAWQCTPTKGCKANDLRVKNVRWTPRDQEKVVWPTYTLTYTNTMGAAMTALLPKTYAVTNETFTFAPLVDVEGYKFMGWSPAKIVKNTTGDITVKAKWRKVVTTHNVNFELAGATRIGGGELEQEVEHGYAAEAPTMRPADGLCFVGWDKAFTNVTSDLVVTAKYERISYRIDYENTKGVVNTNCLGFTIDDLPLTVGSLADTRERKFKGWQPFATIPMGTTTNVELRAEWTDRNWLTVRYELGDHLCRIGGGAVVQTIEFGTSPTLPTIRVDEGYDWAWSAPKTNGTEVVIRGYATAKEYTLQIGGSKTKVNYGVKKTVTAPFDQKTGNGTNIICVGWVGSDNVPASGVETQVTFTVTGPGTLDWVYLTNYWVCVSATTGGSISVTDAKGAVLTTNEFWTVRGSRYFLSAVPEEGFVFDGWLLDGETLSKDSDCEICVTAATCIRAVFEKVNVDCEVNFVLGSHLTWTGGGALTQQVAYGQAAIEPTVRADAGHLFSGWDRDFSCVTNNLTVNSVVSTRKYTVRFVLDEHLTRTGGGALSQQVEHGRAATAPEVAADEGYDFVGWDRDFSQVTADMTVNGSSESRWSSTVELMRGVEMDPIVLDLDAIFGARASEVTSVSVTKLPRGLSYDKATQTISGTPTASGVTTATIKGRISSTESLTESMTFIVRASDEGIVVATCDATRGKTTGSGIYSSGKQVTLRATASRGYVFKGWYDAAAHCVSQASSYAFTMPSSDVVLEAVFITTAEDAASVRVSVNGCVLDADSIATTNIWTGLYLEWPLVATADTAVTVKVSGLPSGLKFAAKANTIYGTPTAGGKTSKIRVTVTTAGKTKVIRTMQVTTDALPAALVGTYMGGATDEPIGSASVTLAKTGKISGKWISEGKTWSMSASGLSAYYPATGIFTAQVTLKCGKDTEMLDLMFGLDESGFGVVESERFSATFVNWKSEPLKTLAGLLKGGQFTVVVDHGVLSGKVGTVGAVTVTGAFDLADGNTYKVRAKSRLVPIVDDMFELFVYYPPAATKGFDGYAATLVLTWNGSDFDVTEVR